MGEEADEGRVGETRRPSSWYEEEEGRAVFESDDGMDDVYEDAPPGFSKEERRARRLRSRRRGGSKTPEWLEVPDEDKHKYDRVSGFLYPKWVALRKHAKAE